MRWIWPTVALVVAAGVAGGVVYFGQDPHHDVVLEHAGQINAIRDDLQALVKVMPPADRDNEWATDSQERSVEAISNMRYVGVVRVANVDERHFPMDVAVVR